MCEISQTSLILLGVTKLWIADCGLQTAEPVELLEPTEPAEPLFFSKKKRRRSDFLKHSTIRENV